MFSPHTILSYCIHPFSYLIPRNKKIWVFIGWHRKNNGEIFTDNAKYLFLHVSNNEPIIKAVWLAKNKTVAEELQNAGYTAYYEKSLRGIFYALCAGVTCIDAYLQPFNFRFSGRTKLAQLLHGKGMKAGAYSVASIRKQNYIFSSSPDAQQMLTAIFTTGSLQYVTGYSRSDVFYPDVISGSEIGTDKEIQKKITQLKAQGTKIVWYAPTFRRGEKHFNAEEKLDLVTLTPLLEKNNMHLCISLHPKYRDDVRTISSSNVTYLEEQDFFPIYKLFDVLITDYSSSFTDFLLLDRPIIFYPYDLDTYIKNEGILIDYQKETPGIKVYTTNELADAIMAVLENDTYASERALIRKKYHKYSDNKSSERITTIIKKHLML